MKYFRLQHANITIEQMRSFTSDYAGDAAYIDEYMFDTAEEYEAATEAQREQYDLTICASTDPYETEWGGAAGIDDAEVIVLEGVKAFNIYDGVRLYSSTLQEVARFPYSAWRKMQETGEVENYA